MCMGSIVIRRCRKKTYAYYVYYDGSGGRVEKYCGAESDPATQRRLLEAEVEEIGVQMDALRRRLSECQEKIGALPSKKITKK